MRIRFFPKALIAGVSICSTPALAQSEDAFSGIRVEALGGYDNTGVDFDDDFYTGGKQSQSGFLYGVAAGYDFRFDSFTVGIEGELSDSTSGKDHDLSGTAGDGQAFTTHVNIDAGGDIYVGARVGYVVAPTVLIYVRGGYSHQKIDIDGSGTKGGVSFTFDDGMGLNGFRLGVGGEMQFTDMIYGKLEYRYSNYTDGNFDVRSNDVNLNPLFENIDVVRHQVGVGVGVRF